MLLILPAPAGKRTLDCPYYMQQTASAIDTNALGLQLFESSPDCLKLLSNEGAIVAMNRNGICAMEIDDFSRFAGKMWQSFWPQESQGAVGAAMAEARAGGTGQFKAFCPTAKGTSRWWEVMVTAVYTEGGRIQNLLAVSRDVTTAHEAEVQRERLLRELQAANARMADIFYQAPAFMCVLNGPDHVFELINERYLQLVGNRDLAGQPVRQALPELAGQGFFELLDGVYRTGDAFKGTDMPVMLQRHPGAPLEQRFVDLVYMPLRDADGKITGLLAHGVDQTERKLAENRLYASRERFAKIVGQAATGVVEMDQQDRGPGHGAALARGNPGRAGRAGRRWTRLRHRQALPAQGRLADAGHQQRQRAAQPLGRIPRPGRDRARHHRKPPGRGKTARQRRTLPHPVRIDGPGLRHPRHAVRRR
jgi:PAS domain S-box-containing protein